VYQSDGLFATKSVSVTLEHTPKPPLVKFFHPETDALTVSISGEVVPRSPGAALRRVRWEWGDGTSEDHYFPATHTYRQGGRYTIRVTAFQSDGLSTTERTSVDLIASVLCTVDDAIQKTDEIIAKSQLLGRWRRTV
jgi:hypothetical protein